MSLPNRSSSASGRLHRSRRTRANGPAGWVPTDDYPRIALNRDNHRVELDDGTRPDTSQVNLQVRVAIGGDPTRAEALITEMRKFLRTARMAGRTEVIIKGETSLQMNKPERYRYEIIEAIAADSAKVMASLGRECTLQPAGPQGPKVTPPGIAAARPSGWPGNLYIRPWKLAVRVTGRVYRDTWDITSGTGEAEVERYLWEGFRIAARGRYYRQSGALFWSDDYTGGDPPLGPKGQYWTGDRELSPFSSLSLGLRLTYNLQPASKPGGGPGRFVGIFSGLKFGASADAMQFFYDEYTLAGQELGNTRAYILGLNLSALF